jgi:hypothetical protein
MGSKTGDHLWKEGQSGNPNGRPPKSRNRRNAELWEKLEASGHKDPALFLSEIVNNTDEPKELRVHAAGLLLPYKYAKATAPAPVVFIEQTLNINKPTTIQQARENILYISELKAKGQIDMAWGDSLIADQRVVLDSLIDETKLLAATGGSPEQTIYIEGGLPPLARAPDDPWLGVTMPPTRMNGKDAIEPDASSGDAPDLEAQDQDPSSEVP